MDLPRHSVIIPETEVLRRTAEVHSVGTVEDFCADIETIIATKNYDDQRANSVRRGMRSLRERSVVGAPFLALGPTGLQRAGILDRPITRTDQFFDLTFWYISSSDLECRMMMAHRSLHSVLRGMARGTRYAGGLVVGEEEVHAWLREPGRFALLADEAAEVPRAAYNNDVLLLEGLQEGLIPWGLAGLDSADKQRLSERIFKGMLEAKGDEATSALKALIYLNGFRTADEAGPLFEEWNDYFAQSLPSPFERPLPKAYGPIMDALDALTPTPLSTPEGERLSPKVNRLATLADWYIRLAWRLHDAEAARDNLERQEPSHVVKVSERFL